ncbi:MAG: GntR family transcriptional regulator [Actinomycetota bacterium]|nr:GntR family transcriptional regulator [Actinomycetota bacterium]
MSATGMALNQELLSDKVYEILRASILDGTRAPGSRIVESELARSLGVSQAPVRDAIKQLAHEGLVTSLPRRGSYVTELSPDEFVVGRKLRAVIEQVGAELVTRAGDADTTGLRDIATKMIEAAKREDRAQLRALDLAFHKTAVELARSSTLVRVWSIIEPNLLSQHVLANPEFSGDWNEIAQRHVVLVDLLEGGDPEAAAAAFHRHAMGAGAHGAATG